MTAETDASGPEPLGLCVVANVARTTAHGDGGLELRSGLRHFAPGAKLWIEPMRWHGRPDVSVAGRHRGSRRYVSMVVQRRHLENFRVAAVHSPALLRTLGGGPLWTAEDAAAYVEWWSTPRLAEAHIAVEGEECVRRIEGITDPPPMELEYEGVTYYLAHFNANRARYSPLPPPVEPAL